jgi:uncharacterized membrane protein YfcA
VLLAVVVGSIVKAVTGMGLPLIAIPVAALFVDLDDAVVTIAFANVLANGVLATRERSSAAETRDLPALVISGILGAVLGGVAFVSLPDEPLIVVLIVAILVYVVMFFVNPERVTSPATSRRWSPVVGSVAGAFQGAIGISGPIFGAWIHSYRLPRGAHILSVTMLFGVTGVTQFTVLVAAGELDGRVVASLLACIPVLASIPVGTWLRGRVSARGFDLAIIAILLVSVAALAVRTLG